MADDSHIRLAEVLDGRLASRFLRRFTLATGLGALMAETDGMTIPFLDAERPSVRPICRRICSTETGSSRCAESHADAGLQAAQLGEPYIFRCHAGLIEWAAPVVFESRYLGLALCGPVLMFEADDTAISEVCGRLSDLEIGDDEVRALLREVRTMSGPGVQAAAELLFIVSNQLAQSGMRTSAQGRELSGQQSRLAEKVLKDAESRATKPIYPLEKENDLLSRVKLGDRQGAKEILNELLGSIFFRTGCSTEVIKARLLELMVMLSRAAVEAGASMEKLLGLNYNYVQELSAIHRFEELCAWIVKVLDAFLDVAAEHKDMRNAKVIQDAVEYIVTNFSRDLTLEEVSQVVHLSPYYLSHLFRSELNCTFVEYVTKVRIENAKRLMKGTNLSLAEICEEVGYKDSSYFSKVFRKAEGVVPSRYRQQAGGR